MIVTLICMTLALFGSTQSASFQCVFSTVNPWGTITIPTYFCAVQNSVNITSVDDAQVDNITGTHLAGYSNDNVEAISADNKGPINYFPRFLNQFFKNLKGLRLGGVGLKEIHQSDLKDFSKLMNLWLASNNVEILEENLFAFNPNLEVIDFGGNKISHIDPNVFANLNKLKTLYFGINFCINMAAGNPTDLQNLIKTAKANCTNLNYSYLEQKVKYLEYQSKILDSVDLDQEVENLETEIENSKFANFFQERIAGLYAVAIEKEREDNVDSRLSDIEEMVANSTGNGKYNIIVNMS